MIITDKIYEALLLARIVRLVIQKYYDECQSKRIHLNMALFLL